MTDICRLSTLKSSVEGDFPFAVSRVFHRCRTSRDEDLGGKYKKLIDLFEALARFLCVVALQDANAHVPGMKDKLPQKEKSLEFLRRPSLGGWLGLLRVLAKLDHDADRAVHLAAISSWFLSPRDSENSEVLAMMTKIEEVGFDTRSKTPVAEMFNAFVTLRNRLFGHGSMLSEDKIRSYIPVMETILSYLLKSATFLSAMRLYFVEKRELNENDQWILHILELNGLTQERLSITSDEKLEARDIYVGRHDGDRFVTPPVKLTPLLIYARNDERKIMEVFYYNNALRTKLEYVSYESGAFYFHKELHSDFENLIRLKLSATDIDESIRDLSLEERTEKAESYFKRAALLQSMNRLEDALELVELSVEYDRRPEYLVLKANLEGALDEDPEVVLQTLRAALEVSPDHPDALRMVRLIETRAPAPAGSPASEEPTDKRPAWPESPTIFHILTPRRFRHYTSAFWLGLTGTWFAVSFLVEALALSPPKDFVGLGGIVIAVTVFCIGLPTVRVIVLNLRLPLSLQLDNMKLDRFKDDWYRRRLNELFGAFVIIDEKIDWPKTVRGERWYYLGYLLFILCLEFLIIQASDSHHLGSWMFAKRVVDYLVIIFTLYPCIRYVIMSTFFVLEYSRLSIKPMLTRINDDGLRAFGPFLSFNVFLATSANVSFFLGASFMNTGPLYGDFPILALISVVVMFWSIGMPYTLYRAAKSAKFKSTHEYASHIEDAFRTFLKDPRDDTLSRYTWLLEKQQIIRKIPEWPLSLVNTLIFVVLANVLLVGTNVWFVFRRTDNVHRLVAFFSSLLPF